MADLDALRRLNPKLLNFPAWLERTGADRIRPLLPLDRPGAILGISPAWDLDAPVSSTKDDAELTSMMKRAAEVMILHVGVTVQIYAVVHRFRFLRWRREYELSIDRLIRTFHPGV
jgi:hypothetical protein